MPFMKNRRTRIIQNIGHKKTTATSTKVQQASEDARVERDQHYNALPSTSRKVWRGLVAENNVQLTDRDTFDLDASVPGPELDEDEEMLEISHEGMDYGGVRQLFEHLYGPAHRRDQRTWKQRIDTQHSQWNAQMPALTDAYLHYRHHTCGDAEPLDADHPFTIIVISISSWVTQPVSQHRGEEANVALIRAGYLGCTPVTPTYAIAIGTLEFYHRLRRHQPRLSVQAMVQSLCDIHDVTYTSSLRGQFSAAFDIYLDIQRRVDAKISKALGRADPDWRVKHACAACGPKLPDDPPLSPARMLAMDGNNSLKRVARTARSDTRDFRSSYFLTREQVDCYKDEVKHRPSANDDGDAPWLGDATDGEAQPTPCAERWKASAAEHEKRTLEIYETTGVFVSACRHGFILKCCEMVRSGELAKYPLAIVDSLMGDLGDDLGVGYDIGCSFTKTVQASEMVGPTARQKSLNMVVNAFHGYAHNRLCQLSFHPLYRSGYGIEDLETLERVFSASNHVASGVRYASRYHWLQAVDLHFQQWDDDKYKNLSTFIFKNYQQALEILEDFRAPVEEMKKHLKISDADIDAWLTEERKLLLNLKVEPTTRTLECEYVEALKKRRVVDERRMAVSSEYRGHTIVPDATGSITAADLRTLTSHDLSKTQKAETERRRAYEQYYLANEAVIDLEVKLGITESWLPQSDKFREVDAYLARRDFQRALDRVQQLVIQRLLELSKANLSGTGYKMRTQIGKALQVRGKAIRTALERYNKLAIQLVPPAPLLHWQDIVNYGVLGEFDLLKHTYSNADVAASPWAVPANREIANKYHKMRRAREEILRLDVEIKHLRHAITVEQAVYRDAIARYSTTDLGIAGELNIKLGSRLRVNRRHLRILDKIYLLPGAAPPPASPASSDMDTGADAPDPQVEAGQRSRTTAGVSIDGDDDEDHEENDDDTNDTLAGLETWCEGLGFDMVDGVPAHMLSQFQV